MKNRLLLLLLCASMLAGCSATARLYPVQGPLSGQSPQPVYVARMTGAIHSGSFSATLSDGEVCKGRWEQIPRPNTAEQANSAGSGFTDSMSAEWDTVYGQGFYVAHVLGARLYARAALNGNKGTTMNVELYKPDNPKNDTLALIKGVAKDNKSNIYKVAF